MREWAEYSLEEEDGRARLVLHGPLLVSTIGKLDRQFRAFEGEVAEIDLSQIGAIDTVGAWTVLRFAREREAEVTGATEQAERLLGAVEKAESSADISPPRGLLRLRVPEQVGQTVVEFGIGVKQMLGFLGNVIVASLSVIRHPSRFRVKALVRQLELVGVSALGIIGLMSFLIGIVIAQQGAAQLQQFGAEI